MKMPENNIHTSEIIENKIKARCEAILKNPISELPFSIYRVPSHIRKNNESYYEPMMVSIGPYHQGKEHLHAMEEHKWRYLGEFINKGKGEKEDYLQEIRDLEPSIRACYFESFELEKEKLVKIMLLDSCFIIQLFIKWRFKEADPVRNIGWALPLLIADLTMIENQIPFFVLKKMYNIYCYGSSYPPDNLAGKRPCLKELLAESLHTMHNGNKAYDKRSLEACTDIKHLLHLYYILFVPAPEITVPNALRVPRNDKRNGTDQPPASHVVLLQVCNPVGFCPSKEASEEERSPRMIPTATELKEYGVTFKKKKNVKNILDVSFKDGVLQIPYIVVEESSRSRYLNLIAYEQCRSTDQKHLTSYAVFMDCLINTSSDVIVLQRCGIIENKLADTAEVAKFFNQLRDCAYIDYEDHYLRQLFVDVNNYCQAFWHKHRAKLCHDYFSSPWTIFSFAVAVVLLVITITKFIYFICTAFF